MKPRRAHYVLSSHWDREWYQTYQYFRHRLVGLLDTTMESISSGELKGPFTLDGQAIPLWDYLEVRPEKADLLRKFLSEKKVIAGPWFVLPDEFLVSGESLVRNLQQGFQLVRKYGGEPSRAGFLCDIFGHNSQMPQIFRGFGINNAFLWRGVNGASPAYFNWEGADGSMVATYRFGEVGYINYGSKVRHVFEPDFVFDEDRAREDLLRLLREEADRTGPKGPVLIFDGGDHLHYDPRHYGALWDEKIAESSCMEILHSSLDAFVDEFTPYVNEDVLCRVGELRESCAASFQTDSQFLLAGVGSSRYPIKKANAECQSLLTQWAEPFSAFARVLTGKEWPSRYLDIAWQYLLQNHAHDSICGCSIDGVYADVLYRFDQCRQIATLITEEALVAIATSVNGELGEREMRVVVFNPLSIDRNDIFLLDLKIPESWPQFTDGFGYEGKSAFGIFLPDGLELPYQRISQRRPCLDRRLPSTSLPDVWPIILVRVAVYLEMPAMGYVTVIVKGLPGDPTPPGCVVGSLLVAPTRQENISPVASGHALENECLRVEISGNGTLTIYDKVSGEMYCHLLSFEDDAEIGDGWSHGEPVNAGRLFSQCCQHEIMLMENGPLQASFAITTRFPVPSAFNFSKMERSQSRADCVLRSVITLRRGQDYLDVQVSVTNAAEDHRLTVVFPTNCQAETYFSDTPFDVVERSIKLRDGNHLQREMEDERKPQQSWTAVSDSQRGLAVISDGALLECGVRFDAERSIVLTLFRAFGRSVMTSGEPGAQLLENELDFRFRIQPFQSSPDRRKLFQCAQDLSGGVRSIQLLRKDVGGPCADVADQLGFFRLDLAGVLTSTRLVDGKLEARFFHPEDSAAEARLTFDPAFVSTEATLVDFSSDVLTNQAPVTACGEVVSCTVNRRQILTIASTVQRIREQPKPDPSGSVRG